MRQRDGWFKVWRKLLDSPVWKNSSEAHKVIVITILNEANHQECKWWDEQAQKEIVLPPGSFTTSIRKLGHSAEVSTKAIRHSVARLRAQGFIQTEAHSHYTLMHVCNWAYYQHTPEKGTAEQTGKGTDRGRVGYTVGSTLGAQQGTHKKEGKEVQEGEEYKKRVVRSDSDESSAPVVPPDLQGLELYEKDAKLCKQWPSLKKAFEQAFPGVDVVAQMKAAHTWEVANPKKRKKDRPRFLNTWLATEQDKGGGQGLPPVRIL